MKKLSLALTAATLLGCAGTVKYNPPEGAPAVTATKDIARSRDEVWANLVPALGKQFFVINNLDKSSGLINVSYSGDPEKYVDCGWVTSVVKNARGERTYFFPASRAQQQYEMFTPEMILIFVDRRMELDGRINLVLEASTPALTKASVNTRYVLKRDQTVRDVNGRSMSFSHSMAFNGGTAGRFAGANDGQQLECRATGALERQLLELMQ